MKKLGPEMPKPKKNHPPRHLSPEARRCWREIVSEYGISDPGGFRILENGLPQYDRAEQIRKTIDEQGLTIVDRFGIPKANPLLAAERDACAGQLAALKALNLDLEPLRDGPGRSPGR